MIKRFVFGLIGTNCYIYSDGGRNAFAVDMADGVTDEYFDYIEKNELNMRYLLLTHAHFDHTKSVKKFIKKYPECIVIISREEYKNICTSSYPFISKNELGCEPKTVDDGDILKFGDNEIKVISTPGHSSGSVCYLIDNELFCGDTVFKNTVGRCDLKTGDFNLIMKSVEKIKKLPECNIYPGHMELTTLTDEKKYNPYFTNSYDENTY